MTLSYISFWIFFSHLPVDRTLPYWPDATGTRIAGWNLRNCESKSFLPIRCWSQICCHGNEKRNCRLYDSSPHPWGGPWGSLVNQGTTHGSGDRKAPLNSLKAQFDQKDTEMPWLKLVWGCRCWEAVEMKRTVFLTIQAYTKLRSYYTSICGNMRGRHSPGQPHQYLSLINEEIRILVSSTWKNQEEHVFWEKESSN